MSKDKQSIQVTIRVRPLSEKQKQQDNRICVDVEDHTHSIQTFYGNENKKFTFDSIANNNTQQDMFLKVGKKSTIYCLEGYNCTIFAYGQTGSGKTFTMMGVDPAHESYDQLRGLIPRTLEYLFESIDMEIKETSSQYIIRCSFLQIYNEQIIDLLNPKNNSNLQIRQDIKKGVYVEGITQETIFKGEQALEILKKGSKGRHVGSTCYNETSSRSHSVFTMQIESKHTKNGVVNTKIRYFHFIDLAGSQRTKQINGQRLKQGCSINKSLHVLGKVINSLAESSESKPRHINYRDSKLTFLLKDSLGGNSKTHLIANVSPCAMSYSETNMTLAFARRVKLIKVNKASINEDMSGNLQGLKSEIKRLKQEIIMLRNGNMGVVMSLDSTESLNQISQIGPSIQTNTQPNSKMIQILNRYVSQELDKQTKFVGQINKLNKKLDCLQNAIKKYAQNQIHLKLIISVYQDKVKRTKKVQSLLTAKIDELNSESDDSIKIIEYFRQEREQLIKQTQNYKQILSQNSNNLLKLLKTCKVYQLESSKQDNKQDLINLLKNNTEFLNLINAQLKQIKQVQLMGVQKGEKKSVQEIIDQKIAMIDLQYSKKETQLLQRVEQLQLQINEFKSSNEQSQLLLKDSVNREINLQEQIKKKENRINQLEQQVNQIKYKELQEKERQDKAHKQLSEVKQQNMKLKKQVEEKSIEMQELRKIQLQASRVKQLMSEKQTKTSEQIRELKSKNIQLQCKISQTQNKLVESIKQYDDSIKQYEQKVSNLEQELKQISQRQAQSSRQLLVLKQQMQEKQYQVQQVIYSHKKQLQELVNTVSRLQSQLLRQQRQLSSLTDVKSRLQEKLKAQQQKASSLIVQLQAKQQQQQKLSLNMIHLQHQSQVKSNKIVHLQGLINDKHLQEQSYMAKSKLKQQQLLQVISQMQSSCDSSSQQFHKIRIQFIHVKQTKSQLQLKNYKLDDQIKQLNLQLNSKLAKILQLNLQLEEKTKKILTEKQQIAKKKQEIRTLTYLIEQSKSQNSKLHHTISLKDEQFQQLHSKNISLLQSINHTKNQLTHSKLHLKQLQTKLFCLQKSSQIQKQSLLNQNLIKIHKLNQSINAKTSQIKKLQKIITQQKLHLDSITSQSNAFKQLNAKNQEFFKRTLQKQLISKSSQISSLKSTVTSLQDLIQTLKSNHQNKVQQLDQNVEQLKVKVKRLNLQLQNLKQNLSTNQLNLQQKQALVKTLQDSIQQLKVKQERELQDLEIQHNQQIDSKNQQIDKNNELIIKKEQQIEKKNKQIYEKDQQIEKKDQQINEKSQQIQYLNQQIERKNQEILRLQDQICQSTQSLQAKQRTIQQLQQKLSENSKKITVLRQQIIFKDEIIKQTQSQADEKQNNTLCKLNAFIQQKETIIQQKETIQSLKQQNIQSLKEQKEQLERQRQIMIREKQQMNAKIDRLKQEIGELKDKLSNLKLDKQKSQGQLREKQLQIQRLKEKLIESEQKSLYKDKTNKCLQSTIQVLNRQIGALESQLSCMNNQLIQGKGQVSQTIKLNEQKQRLISQLNKQLYELQKTHTQQKSQLIPQLSKQISTGKSIIESKQQQINLLHLSMKELHLQLQQLKNQHKKLQQKYEEMTSHNYTLESSIQELSHKLNQINCINQQVQGYNQQLKRQNSQFAEQIKSLKQHHDAQIKQQKQQKQLLIQEKQTFLNNLSQIKHQKEQLTESYKSLQQINKGLGKKCEELITNLQQQKTEYRKLQTKYLGQKNINQNLKQILQNSDQQKKHLTLQIKEKTQIYNKLVQKISKNESLHADKQKKSQHYLKTVDLLQKSRFQQLQLRKSNEQLKRQLNQKTQLVQKKQSQLKETTKKYENIQSRVKQFQEDYLELQSKYQQLLENQKIYDKWEQENLSLKQQLQQTRPKISRMTLKIQQLQQRIRSINEEYIELQNQNHNLKKKILYPGTADERTSMYINTLKSQINDLKKQKLILQDTIKKQTSQKMKLKTQMIKNSPHSSQITNQTQQIRQQLEKRLTQIRYLQEIIAQMVDILKIKQFEQGTNPKSIKIESIRKGIVTSIKEKIKQNTMLKQRIHEIESRLNIKQKQNKSVTSILYNGVGSQNSAKKQTSFNQSTQKIQKRQKSFSTKEQQLSSMIRNKINNSVSGAQYSQEKREKKGLTMDGLRNLIDNDEANLNNTREKMKVKEIVTNSGKFYKNLQ